MLRPLSSRNYHLRTTVYVELPKAVKKLNPDKTPRPVGEHEFVRGICAKCMTDDDEIQMTTGKGVCNSLTPLLDCLGDFIHKIPLQPRSRSSNTGVH